MTSEVEEGPRFVMRGYGRHRSQWVKHVSVHNLGSVQCTWKSIKLGQTTRQCDLFRWRCQFINTRFDTHPSSLHNSKMASRQHRYMYSEIPQEKMKKFK